MTGILADIIEYKRDFIVKQKREFPQGELAERAAATPAPRDFVGALTGGGCSLIAEIKTASPSKGVIRDDIDPVEVARIYAENGAACISVLTDERFFQGSLDRLVSIRHSVDVPLLRKDFIIDEYQIVEARWVGADAVLLIAACLEDEQLRELSEIARNLGLACLVEVHDEEEMERVSPMDVRLIGINNRDLRTFRTDLAVTGQLAPLAPGDAIVVSESGIFTAADVEVVHRMGAHAVLVGEALMKASDIGAKVREITRHS